MTVFIEATKVGFLVCPWGNVAMWCVLPHMFVWFVCCFVRCTREWATNKANLTKLDIHRRFANLIESWVWVFVWKIPAQLLAVLIAHVETIHTSVEVPNFRKPGVLPRALLRLCKCRADQHCLVRAVIWTRSVFIVAEGHEFRINDILVTHFFRLSFDRLLFLVVPQKKWSQTWWTYHWCGIRLRWCSVEVLDILFDNTMFGNLILL